ncbi:MAG TPA: class A beta-lactamase [Albitalea sp.]|uniref:class A beta-lactamase n=1 Tax=Piscinibacter sp. TaxID=1903157 RepID=UPI002ED09FE5
MDKSLFPVSRRRVLALSAGLAGASWAPAHAGTPDAAAALAELERRSGGRLGVHATDGHGRTLGHVDDAPFALCSTFKLLLAAAVLHRHDQAGASLDRRLRLRPADIVAHSPVSAGHVKAGFITVRQACEATVQVSDNAAANLLLPLVGGPAGLTAFLRERCGDAATRLDRAEPALNSNLPDDPRDTTTPRAMARTALALATGPTLAAPSRELLVGWMRTASTGLQRLRAGLPPDWVVGDKTGTGENGAVNDVAVAWPPGRPPIALAVYMSGSRLPRDELNAIHAQVAGLVAAAFG